MINPVLDCIAEQWCFDILDDLNDLVRKILYGQVKSIDAYDHYKSAVECACMLRVLCRRYYERTRAGIDAYLAFRHMICNPARTLLSNQSCLVLENPIDGVSRRALIDLAREFERRMPLWHESPLRQAGALEGGISLPTSLEVSAYHCSWRSYGSIRLMSEPHRHAVHASIRPANFRSLINVDVWRDADADHDGEKSPFQLHRGYLQSARGWASPSFILFKCRYGVPLHVFETFVETMRDQGFIIVQFNGVRDLASQDDGRCKLTKKPSGKHTGRIQQIRITQRDLVKDFGFGRKKDYTGYSNDTILSSPRHAVLNRERELRVVRAYYRDLPAIADRRYPQKLQRQREREVQRAEVAVVTARAKLSQCRRALDTYRERSRRRIHSSTP